MTLEDFNRLTAGLRLRLALLVGRGVIQAVDDGGDAQRVQVTFFKGSTRWVDRFQNYGFSSNPPRGLSIVAAFLNGDWARGFGLSIGDHAHRPRGLQPGEVVIYTDEGDLVVFKRGRQIEVTAGAKVRATAPLVEIVAATKVRMETPLLEVTGHVKDLCDGAGRTMADMRAIYNGHTHPEPDGGTGAPNQGM